MSERTTAEISIHNRMQIPRFTAGKDGPSPFSAGTMNLLLRILEALCNPQIKRTGRDAVTVSDGNFLIEIKSDSSGTGSAAKMMKLVSVQDDYLTCHSWDGTTEGTDPIYVAKQYAHRCSLTGETIYGTAHTYTYAAGPDSDNKVRTDTDGSNTEDQRIIRPWIPGEILFPVAAEATGVTVSGTPLTLVDFSSRQWARIS